MSITERVKLAPPTLAVSFHRQSFSRSLLLQSLVLPVLFDYTDMQMLDLSSNFLAGLIPTELSSLINLHVLNLSANRLAIVGMGLGSGMLILALSFSAVCTWLKVKEQSNARVGEMNNTKDVEISHLMLDY